MPLYICQLCNFNSKLKGDYNRHLKTKKHRNNCESTNEISKDLMVMNQNEPQMSQNEPQMNQNEPTKSHKCEYCDETFNTIPSKRRHELHRCKNNSNVSDSIIMKQEHQIKKLEKQMEKQKKELMKQIEVLLTKVGNTTINNTQNNNIQLNNYGNEDLSHITDKQKTQMLKIPYVMIQRLIEFVHFNDKKPENKNIMIVNKKDKYIKIFKDGKWIYKDKKETLEMLVDGKYFILDEHFNEIPDEDLSDIQRNRYLIFQNKYDSKDNELHKFLLDKTELFLLNQMNS